MERLLAQKFIRKNCSQTIPSCNLHSSTLLMDGQPPTIGEGTGRRKKFSFCILFTPAWKMYHILLLNFILMYVDKTYLRRLHSSRDILGKMVSRHTRVEERYLLPILGRNKTLLSKKQLWY